MTDPFDLIFIIGLFSTLAFFIGYCYANLARDLKESREEMEEKLLELKIVRCISKATIPINDKLANIEKDKREWQKK